MRESRGPKKEGVGKKACGAKSPMREKDIGGRTRERKNFGHLAITLWGKRKREGREKKKIDP